MPRLVMARVLLYRHGAAFQAKLFVHAGGQRGLGNEGQAERAEHRPVMDRLRGGDGGARAPIGVVAMAPMGRVA